MNKGGIGGEPGARNLDATHALGRLAAEAAHDLNNHLGVILGNAQLVLMDLPEDSPWREDLREIEGGARRAAEFSRLLLAYARDQTRRTEPADPWTVIRDLERIVGHSLRESTDG